MILTLGNIVMEALEAAQELSRRGVECAVAIVSTLNPGPEHHLAELLTLFPLTYTLEAHSIRTGLGSLIAEIIAEHGIQTRLVRCGIRSVPDGFSGSQKFLYEKYGISSDALVASIVSEYKGS